MFGRRQYLVNSRDRATGSATNFLYRLPNQMRDVVHVNLLHCIVENGVFNVDDTNNKFMLNQESNTLTDEFGVAVSYADFPYLANQLLAYKDSVVASPVYWGVGKGGGALLWCEPTLQPDSTITLDWAIKQPTNAQIWNNNIGNATELMCIASNQNGTIIVGGNNLVSQGYGTNFAVCTDAFLGGDASSFDTNYATGGPSKSVNAIAYASIGGNPRWVCTGDDSLATTPNAIKVDDSNNQIVINLVDLQQTKIFLSSNLIVKCAIILNNSELHELERNIVSGFYTKEEYATALDVACNECWEELASSYTRVIRSQITYVDSNNNFNITVKGPDEDVPNWAYIKGSALEILGLNPDGNTGMGISWEGWPYGGPPAFNFPYPLVAITFTTSAPAPNTTIITGSDSDFKPQIQLGLPTTDLTATIPIGSYNGSTFASQIVSTINSTINLTPMFAGFNVNITAVFNGDTNIITFQDQTAGHPLDITLKQFGDTQNPVRVAFAQLLGLNYDFYIGPDATDSGELGYNKVNFYSTWTSIDGIEWTAINNSALENVVGNSISIIDTTTGPAVIIGMDDGIVYNNAIDLTTWSILGKSTQLSTINYGKVYAVETTLNQANDGVVVAIGCLGGQVYYDDDFWISPTPTPTLLTTLTKSPNDYDPVCNAIKYTGNTTGNYPTWIFAGSSMSYITSTTPTLQSTTPVIVPFNSGPAQDPSGYPFLEYINAIATYEEGGVLYTALGGDNTGQYSCTDITASATLDSWTGLQPFKNNVLIQIPTGYYTNTSLASTVAELLNNQAISGNGTFYTEVQTDGTFVVANTTSGNWGIRFMNGTFEYTGTAKLLGFSDVSKQYEPSVLAGQDGPYTIKSDVEGGIDLVPFEYVLLQSDKFGNDLMTNSGLSAWWLVPNVANGVNSNSIVYENTRNPTLEYLTNPRDIEQFDIRVLNSNGEIIELQDNKNVTLVIEFYTKKAGCR